MRLQDALFNWLQIKAVADARPVDHAALETEQFFAEILREDHHLEQVSVDLVDDTIYHVRYVMNGEQKTQMFDREATEQLLHDINSNPKYNE